MLVLEQFTIECRKTKTKVITAANHKGLSQSSEPIKTRSKYMQLAGSAGKRAQASHDWFGFSSDWLRKWREIFKPITERSNAKPKQTQFTFGTK